MEPIYKFSHEKSGVRLFQPVSTYWSDWANTRQTIAHHAVLFRIQKRYTYELNNIDSKHDRCTLCDLVFLFVCFFMLFLFFVVVVFCLCLYCSHMHEANFGSFILSYATVLIYMCNLASACQANKMTGAFHWSTHPWPRRFNFFQSSLTWHKIQTVSKSRSEVNHWRWWFNIENSLDFGYFNIYDYRKFLSLVWKMVYNHEASLVNSSLHGEKVAYSLGNVTAV